MKKLLPLLAVLLLMMSVTTAYAAANYKLHLDIDYDANVLMARYDVDVYINDVKLARIEHGKSLKTSVLVSSGNCVITFRSAKDEDVCRSTTISVSKETSYACTLHANLASLELRKVKTDADEPDIRVPYGTAGRIDDVEIRVKGYRTVHTLNGVRPASGNTILICQVEFNNLSDSDIVVSAPLFFEACVDDYETDLLYKAMFSLSKEDLIGSLKSINDVGEIVRPGKRTVAELVYEVPKDWKVLELFYQPLMIGPDLLNFIVPNTQSN